MYSYQVMEKILCDLGLVLVNDMQNPPFKSDQIKLLVPKDAQFSETYAETIFRFLNFFLSENF